MLADLDVSPVPAFADGGHAQVLHEGVARRVRVVAAARHALVPEQGPGEPGLFARASGAANCRNGSSVVAGGWTGGSPEEGKSIQTAASASGVEPRAEDHQGEKANSAFQIRVSCC
ncbi:hypothetical protein D3C86_1569020 [compost metagenome]